MFRDVNLPADCTHLRNYLDFMSQRPSWKQVEYPRAELLKNLKAKIPRQSVLSANRLQHQAMRAITSRLAEMTSKMNPKVSFFPTIFDES
jgi:hypothetical protein